MNKNDLEQFFTYQKPGDAQVATMQKLREKALELSDLMDDSVADCADKSTAIRKLREAVMAINSAIVLYGKVSGYGTQRHKSGGPSFKVDGTTPGGV